MATANSNIEHNFGSPGRCWPHEPEALLALLTDDLEGSPYEMLINVLTRVQCVVALLCAEFMGGDEYRPKDQEIVGALWITQSQLQLARDLVERLGSEEK